MSSLPVNLNNTIGCLFLTGIFTTVLWTTSTIQMYNYYRKYSRNDTWRLKAHVALAWLLDTAYQITVMHAAYLFFVTGFGSISTLTRMQKNTFSLMTILSAFLMVTVQASFVMRIWNLSKQNKLLAGTAIILVLAQFSITMAYFALITPLTEFTQLTSIITVSRAMNATIASVDVVIAAILVFLLHTNRSGFKRTDSVINRLISYTIASGLLTGVDAFLALIVSLTLPNTYIYLIFEGVGAMLYVVSMLFLLNSRQKVREELDRNTSAGVSEICTGVLRARCIGSSQGMKSSTDLGIEERSGSDGSLIFTSKESHV